MTPKYRRLSLVIASLLGLALAIGTAVFHMNQLHQRLLGGRIQFIEQKIAEVVRVVDSYHQLTLNGRMPAELARIAALRTIAGMRFGDNDYFWVVDYSGNFVMHPIDSSLIGRPIETHDSRDGRSLAQKIPALLSQQGGGVLHYRWPKPGAVEPVDKISYVAGFEPWRWALGTGVYVDDINAMFWQEVLDLVIVAAVLLMILLLFWYGFSQAAFQQSIYRRQQSTK